MCPTTITASSEERENVMAQRGTAVRVPAIHIKNYIVAVKHNRRRGSSPFWLGVVLEGVQIEVNVEISYGRKCL